MATIAVYGTPNCMQCTQTVRTFERAGLELGRDFSYVDLSTNPAAHAYVTQELGYSRAPVVVLAEQDHWSGLRPGDNKRAIAVALAAREDAPVTGGPAIQAAPAEGAQQLRAARERVRVERQQPSVSSGGPRAEYSTYQPDQARARGPQL